MDQRVLTTLTIGGIALRAVIVDELAALAEPSFPEASSPNPARALIAKALASHTAVSFEGERDQGRADELEAFCREHGLAYHRAWTSCLSQFDAGLEYWRPGMTIPVSHDANEGGDPLMSLHTLTFLLGQGCTLQDVVAQLAEATSTAVPPLTALDPPAGVQH